MDVVQRTVGRLSPTFLATFLGCQASAAWTLEHRQGRREPPVTVSDPQGDLIKRKGQEHEDRCIATLTVRHGPPVVIASGTLEHRIAATRAAMDRGERLITHAALADRHWIGYADLLVRVEEPCPSWAWSYKPWDAKLARTARPEHVMQIAFYGDLLEFVQG